MLNKCKLERLKDCKVAKLIALGVVAVTSCLGVGVLVYKKVKGK